MWKHNKNKLLTAGAAVVGALLSVQVSAGTVSYKGAEVSVFYDIDDGNSQLVSFEYLFSVGDAATAGDWIGTTMDALSIQLGSAGNNSNSIIDDISSFSTNSDNVIGEWSGVLGKVAGNGCQDNESETVCYTRDPTGLGGAAEETVIMANTDYSFQFDVLFLGNVDVPGVLAGDHSIKFLSLTQNGGGGWSTGLQLSESGSFMPRPGPGPDPDPNPVPAPGALYLFVLGLLGLGVARRRSR